MGPRFFSMVRFPLDSISFSVFWLSITNVRHVDTRVIDTTILEDAGYVLNTVLECSIGIVHTAPLRGGR